MSEKHQVHRESTLGINTTTSCIIDPNQVGDPEGQPDSRPTAGKVRTRED